MNCNNKLAINVVGVGINDMKTRVPFIQLGTSQKVETFDLQKTGIYIMLNSIFFVPKCNCVNANLEQTPDSLSVGSIHYKRAKIVQAQNVENFALFPEERKSA